MRRTELLWEIRNQRFAGEFDAFRERASERQRVACGARWTREVQGERGCRLSCQILPTIHMGWQRILLNELNLVRCRSVRYCSTPSADPPVPAWISSCCTSRPLASDGMNMNRNCSLWYSCAPSGNSVNAPSADHVGATCIISPVCVPKSRRLAASGKTKGRTGSGSLKSRISRPLAVSRTCNTLSRSRTYKRF